MNNQYQKDVDAVLAIAAVPTILDVVCRTTGMGFAAVARVTEDRWIACQVLDSIAFGLQPGGELKVESTICHEIRQNHLPVVINHVDEDETYRSHHTPLMYGFQSYISMPIILPDGQFFGTLCAIDPRPAQLNNPQIIGMFKMFADLVGFHLDAQERLEASAATLLDERAASRLRDQFIAVLGHDLRNPLASIDAGTRMLTKTPLDERAVKIVGLMQSTTKRMGTLIDNVLDFARGRLGGGLRVDLERGRAIEPTLMQVVAELRSAWPDRTIETRFDMQIPVNADHSRIAQLFSNLLGNALTHGLEDTPVWVEAYSRDGMFGLSVANAGAPIEPAAMQMLFEPFYRGDVRPTQQGLGLGLYIASQIAKAHGGQLTVTSASKETRFSLTMPA